MGLVQRERVQETRNQILKGQHMAENTSKRYNANKRYNGDDNYKRNSYKRKNKGKQIFSKLVNAGFYLAMIGMIVVLFIMYGPYNGFRDWYITTAMKTMNHQYLATWFYSAESINTVLENNKILEVSGITDTSKIKINSSGAYITYENEYEKEILEKDPNHPEYKIIDIDGDNYSGYLAVVYDASKLHAMVTSKLNVSGQYVTKMAEDNKAVLAINGGFFVDLKEDRTGGTPLGITVSNGKIITDDAYNGEGGLIGFDTDNKLVLGKLTVAQTKKMNIRDAVTSGPFLIINGESSKIVGNGGWGTAPRTAIGQRQDGVVLMLVIDGRQVGRAGAEMEDLIEIMERYGAYNAAALDGGTSSVMVENYEIINDPIDSDGVHKTRPVATAFGLILDDNK